MMKTMDFPQNFGSLDFSIFKGDQDKNSINFKKSAGPKQSKKPHFEYSKSSSVIPIEIPEPNKIQNCFPPIHETLLMKLRDISPIHKSAPPQISVTKKTTNPIFQKVNDPSPIQDKGFFYGNHVSSHQFKIPLACSVDQSGNQQPVNNVNDLYYKKNTSDYNQEKTILTLNSLQIHRDSFFRWVDDSIKNYVYKFVIPNYIKKNQTNLKNLNECLLHFNVKLVEFDTNPREPKIRSFDDHLRNDLQNITHMKLAQLIPMRNNIYDKWGSFFNINNGLSSSKVKELQVNIQAEIAARINLDKLITINGYKLTEVRMKIMQRLCALAEHQAIEYNNCNKNTQKIPSDADIILYLFIGHILQHNPLSNKNVIQDILIDPSLPVPFRRKEDFYLKKIRINEDEEYEIFVGEKKDPNYEWYPLHGPGNIWSIMVYLLLHIKIVHFNDEQMAKNKENESEDLMALKKIISIVLNQQSS